MVAAVMVLMTVVVTAPPGSQGPQSLPGCGEPAPESLTDCGFHYTFVCRIQDCFLMGRVLVRTSQSQ